MGWTMLYLFVALKIPIVAGDLARLVGDQAGARPPEDVRDDGGTTKRPHPIRAAAAQPPRRGPHGEPAPPSPPRVRTVRARGRRIKR